MKTIISALVASTVLSTAAFAETYSVDELADFTVAGEHGLNTNYFGTAITAQGASEALSILVDAIGESASLSGTANSAFSSYSGLTTYSYVDDSAVEAVVNSIRAIKSEVNTQSALANNYLAQRNSARDARDEARAAVRAIELAFDGVGTYALNGVSATELERLTMTSAALKDVYDAVIDEIDGISGVYFPNGLTTAEADIIIAALGDYIDAKDATIQTLNNSINGLNTAVAIAEGNADTWQSAALGAQAIIVTRNAQLATANDALASAQASVASVSADLSASAADLLAAQADLALAQADLTAAEGELATAEADLVVEQLAHAATQASLDTANASLTTATAGVAPTITHHYADAADNAAIAAGIAAGSAADNRTIKFNYQVGEAAVQATHGQVQGYMAYTNQYGYWSTVIDCQTCRLHHWGTPDSNLNNKLSAAGEATLTYSESQVINAHITEMVDGLVIELQEYEYDKGYSDGYTDGFSDGYVSGWNDAIAASGGS